MRSTGFVCLSVLVHCLAFGAIALTPTRTVTNAGEKIEVAVGETADAPGVADVPAIPEPSKAQAVSEPAPAQPVLPPAPKAEVKPQEVKPLPVKAQRQPVKTVKPSSPKKVPVVATAAPVEQDEKSPAPKAAPAAEPTPVAETQEPKQEKEILIPVKETAPAGVEAATDEEVPAATEAKSADVQKTADPTPVAVATTTDAKEAGGDLNKGGASKEGAVSYLDLKQMPGNKSPNYPMQARRDQRQGALELEIDGRGFGVSSGDRRYSSI